MHAISTLRYDAASGKEAPYYRLKESYRDVHGHVHSLILLNIGFEPTLTPRQVHRIAEFLSDRFENRDNPSLFNGRTDCLTDIEHAWAEKFWRRMIDEGHIDRFNRKEGKAREEARRYIDLNTVEHTDARNVGAEWLCKQAIDRLDIENFLRGKGWKEESIRAALAHLIVRTVYAPSEWGAHRIMRDSSDCRLLVLALCINAEGFIRYSSILEGNAADPASLPDMVHMLSAKSGNAGRRTLVVMDAGIATSDNLRMLRRMGYDYLCVTRNKIKDYTISHGHTTVEVTDSRGKRITLRRVQPTGDGDTYFEVVSPSKALTEASMNRMWKERFEGELNKINAAMARKGGTKRYEKVVERTGRAIERYPSIARFYDIEYVRDEQKPAQMAEVRWKINSLTGIQRGTGVYFLRTNVSNVDGRTAWDYYNLIREIETTNRQLKTDLNPSQYTIRKTAAATLICSSACCRTGW